MDPNKYDKIQVSGGAIIPVIKGFASDALCKILFEQYELKDVEKDEFYPLSNYLKLLRSVERQMSSMLEHIGTHISQEAIMPPDIPGLEQFLKMMDKVYHLNHRGYRENEIGHYRYVDRTETGFLMSVDVPYPCQFDQGIFIGFVEKFGLTLASVDHTDDKCRAKGDQCCNYHIQIEG